MRKELDDLLCKKYPKIFRDRHAPMTHTAMCWGFECGDGWFNIIDSMCGNIQRHIDHKRKSRLQALRFNRALKKALNGDIEALIKHNTTGKGSDSRAWAEKQTAKTLEDPKFREPPNICPQVIAIQVKEKFGTLRFYYYGGDEYCRGVESMADTLSAVTCEECGNPGKLLSQGWHRTLCKTHAEEYKYDWGNTDE